jgi:3-hydroxyisobutyrate dehydrogenase-like beta-hydroxyacid dehydrogenase
MKVAFIGLGNIGAAVANCILKAGFDLTVWNRSPEKAVPLVAGGARLAKTPREAVRDADIVVTCLMDDKMVLDTVSAPDGLLAGMRPGSIHACAMTISPACADELERRHAAHGSIYVSAPVVGRPDAAARGELATLLGGPADAVRNLEPLCRSYAKLVTIISERPRLANVMKLAINYNVACTMQLISETYIFAEKNGLPVDFMREFYQQQWYAHPAAKFYADKLQKRDFQGRGGFVMTGGLKDLKLMLSTAAAVGAQLKVGDIVAQMFEAGIAEGMGEQDWSAFHELARKNAGL